MNDKKVVKVQVSGLPNSGKTIILSIIENALKAVNIEHAVISSIELTDRPENYEERCRMVLDEGVFQHHLKVELDVKNLNRDSVAA